MQPARPHCARIAHALRTHWDVVDLPARILFRVAVRETEETLMCLTKRGRNRRLAVKLVPAAGSGARIGPLYNERLVPFVLGQWDIDAASAHCPGLQRMRDRLAGFLR